MVNDDDKPVLIALAVRHQSAWLQNKADKAAKEELELKIAAADGRLKAIRAAVKAFGVDADVAGWYYPLRDMVGGAEFDKAMRDAGLTVKWGTPPDGYAVSNGPQEDILPALGPENSIRELVLERLKLAGPEGAKSDPIRKSIETLRGASLHFKTIGMTLYRLSQEGLARRDGRTWFYVSPGAETQNPGALTPGLFNREDKKGEEP